MWSSLAIIAIAAAIMKMEAPSLKRKQLAKELRVFYLLLLTGTILSIAMLMHVELPNPMRLVHAVYKPLSDWYTRVLK
ncbi:hypothetical protein [Paenibacillus apiarius]|uniref:Uncharacterized protein n=1 Tax=Paenibacillus apiarius TaxID=46240 RepID=A0ABT4DTK5_9BACL|nr:hypothetical protein [Paenibacillus apiarius]MCY9513931.1 hypothetical protein [Paenibacillus apiarius]MCY9519448.1 hypothetical protein [Paenibacillus apiarius]MCY9552325.1 hypothetical protein [Paenibacillus apiarius]MCY9556203.1 hypothetical protein [Paenibacillus apiarius]MCY9681738.1 hypothetical protein [Paenibacillus apiarius]